MNEDMETILFRGDEKFAKTSDTNKTNALKIVLLIHRRSAVFKL